MILSLDHEGGRPARGRPGRKCPKDTTTWTADHGDHLPRAKALGKKGGAARAAGWIVLSSSRFRTMLAARVAQESRPRSRSNRDSSHEVRLGSTQCTRETASGDRKRVVRGGGALSGIIVRTRGSNRRRKWASTLSDMPVPALPALKELAVIGVIAEQERAE